MALWWSVGIEETQTDKSSYTFTSKFTDVLSSLGFPEEEAYSTCQCCEVGMNWRNLANYPVKAQLGSSAKSTNHESLLDEDPHMSPGPTFHLQASSVGCTKQDQSSPKKHSDSPTQQSGRLPTNITKLKLLVHRLQLPMEMMNCSRKRQLSCVSCII